MYEIQVGMGNFQIKFNKTELFIFPASGTQGKASEAGVCQIPSSVSVPKLLGNTFLEHCFPHSVKTLR